MYLYKYKRGKFSWNIKKLNDNRIQFINVSTSL